MAHFRWAFFIIADKNIFYCYVDQRNIFSLINNKSET